MSVHDIRQYKLNHQHVPAPIETAHRFTATSALVKLPAAYDISASGPPIWDQGQLGSCTAHGTLRSAWYAFKRHYSLLAKPLPFDTLSRAFVYANTRLESGDPITQDDGGTVRGAMEAIRTDFTVDETKYPYTPDHYFVKPPADVYSLAKKEFHHCRYLQVAQRAADIKHAIYTGRPVSFGAQVYSSFMSDAAMATGVLPYPDVEHESLEGGHCMALVGWDDAKEHFVVANSWGTSVGLPHQPGYFYMPYKYIEDKNLCSDFWFVDVLY
jgi:C1A family cysteine protease